jgi:hypothetical protein
MDLQVMGVRDRNQLVPQDLDAQSAAVVDHLLDLVTRSPEEIDRELRHGRILTPSSSPSSTQVNPMFTCFTSTKVQILTPAELRAARPRAMLGVLFCHLRQSLMKWTR